jgi:kanamycin kinase
MDVRPRSRSRDPGPWSTEGLDVPAIVLETANGDMPELTWRNELHGLTFRLGERYMKWSPRSTGIDLNRERVRLEWLQGRHPAPVVLDYGEDEIAQWMLTAALPARSVVRSDRSVPPEVAVPAIAHGLLALHGLSVEEFPAELSIGSWANREPSQLGPKPAVDGPVVVHGDACAPNTLIGADNTWAGHVDLGDLTVGDRWADLAVASMSLEWNYTPPPLEELFWRTYGVLPDEERICYYRALWYAES